VPTPIPFYWQGNTTCVFKIVKLHFAQPTKTSICLFTLASSQYDNQLGNTLQGRNPCVSTKCSPMVQQPSSLLLQANTSW